MQKRDLLGYLALGFMAVAMTAAIYYLGFAPQHFRVALPPADSEPAQLFNAMSAALKRDQSRVRLTTISFESNEAIVKAMEAGQVDLAVARTDRPLPRLSLGVAKVHEFVTLILIRPGAEIENFAALKGRSIGELTRAEAGAGVFSELAAFNDMQIEDLNIIPIKSREALGVTIAENKLDAVFLIAPRGSRAIGEAVRAVQSAFGAPPEILALKEANAIATRISALELAEIAIGELSANPPLPAAVAPTLKFPALLVVRSDMASSSDQDLTRQIFNVRNSLVAQYPAASRLAALDTERGASFAVHPGAAIYYDASETSILERYSDVLWLLLFGFSTIVSAAVWFLRRLFPKQREMLREEHAELTQLLQSVRTAKHTADLNEAEERIDSIVSGISQMSFDGKMDSEQQPAFDLLIARLEKNIESRRQWLEDNKTA